MIVNEAVNLIIWVTLKSLWQSNRSKWKQSNRAQKKNLIHDWMNLHSAVGLGRPNLFSWRERGEGEGSIDLPSVEQNYELSLIGIKSSFHKSFNAARSCSIETDKTV